MGSITYYQIPDQGRQLGGSFNVVRLRLSLFCHFGKIQRIYVNRANEKSRLHPSLTEEGYRDSQLGSIQVVRRGTIYSGLPCGVHP